MIKDLKSYVCLTVLLSSFNSFAGTIPDEAQTYQDKGCTHILADYLYVKAQAKTPLTLKQKNLALTCADFLNSLAKQITTALPGIEQGYTKESPVLAGAIADNPKESPKVNKDLVEFIKTRYAQQAESYKDKAQTLVQAGSQK